MSAAAALHRLTRHGSALDAADRELLVTFRPLDPSNRPAPFKRYVGREPVPLTRDLALSTASAASLLSGTPRGVVDGPWNEQPLARLLFFANGVSRLSRTRVGEAAYFRTAMSAGNLHPVEIYVACGDLDGVPAGIHHFAPLEFGRTELRRGDFRDAFAAAAADPGVAEAPVTLVVTGIPWRTAWKYGERGWRHLYWDAGTMLANLLALESSASVRVGFADGPISRLIGLDSVSEFPVALVVLHGSQTGHREAKEKVGAVEPLDLAVEATSRAPIEFPLATAAQHDGDLADATAVNRWRAAARSLGTPALAEVEPPTSASDDPIETVILRRGSTRLMRHETVDVALLTWGLAVAARAVAGDVASENDATLLEHFVSVHDVEGVESGSYRLGGGRLQHGRDGQPRDVTAHLCFDQPLGGDSAYTVFHAADLDEVLGALGSRGYRAAQLEAGIAAGRLALGAFTLGYGATGLTFYDEAVSQHFATKAACMLVTSVGVPDYRNTPGGPPGAPTQLARFDQLMERLTIQLRRGGF